jgi:hypothetical protein
LIGKNSTMPDLYAAFGQRTASMPTTGTAQYLGFAFGEYRQGSNEHQYTGEFRMNADFQTGALAGSTRMGSHAPAPGVNPDFDFTGSISGSEFTAPFTTADQKLTGTIGGVFAGPNAAEVAGTFVSNPVPSGDTYEGGFVARR